MVGMMTTDFDDNQDDLTNNQDDLILNNVSEIDFDNNLNLIIIWTTCISLAEQNPLLLHSRLRYFYIFPLSPEIRILKFWTSWFPSRLITVIFLPDPGVSGVRSMGPGLSMSVPMTPLWNFADEYSGWWWYQLNTIDDANLKQFLAIRNQCHICKLH